ncbi:flagellar motor switch protein FliM [Treponema sp. R8-4-B8]
MTEVLTSDEIDQLLTAINAEYTKPDNSKPVDKTRKIKIYDFKRPDRFLKEQIWCMSVAHETFANLASASLSAMLQSKVQVHVASVDQLTYEEFIRSVPTPTTMTVINMEPLNGSAVLEIDPAIAFSIFDLLLGGSGEGTRHQHELTRIEKTVIKRAATRLLDNLKETWAKIIDLQPQLVYIETNPQFVQIVHPTEMVILITLETKVGDIEGMINIAYPYPVIKGVLDNLTAAYQYGAQATSIKKYTLINREYIPVKMTAELFNRNFPISEITEWKEEKVILPLRRLASNNCYLCINGKRLWQCEILKEDKLFPKQIKIIEAVKNPFGTERKKMEINKNNQTVTDVLAMAEIKISVELGSAYKSLKEILEINKGTIIELDTLTGEPLDVTANGVLIAKGEVVVIDENFGVRITDILGSPEKTEE